MSWGQMNAQGNMAADVLNQPFATEYTLQGVMRFLQTEWHRHERERNSWEIEKQEMKGRIASLEGAARRSDATQKALKKYVAILEKKVKEQAVQLKPGTATAAGPVPSAEDDREKLATKMIEKLRGNPTQYPVEDEGQRSELRTFLDSCHSEFSYLMITPANPVPPRDSPPLPLEDMREEDYNMSMAQEHLQQQHHHQQQSQQHMEQLARQSYRQPHSQTSQPPQQQHHQQPGLRGDFQTADMSRPAANNTPDAPFGSNTPTDWPTSAPDTALMNSPPNIHSKADSTLDSSPSANDAWDFNDGPTSLPEIGQPTPQPLPTRPDTDAFPTADSMPKSPGRQPGSHRRKSSLSRRRNSDQDSMSLASMSQSVHQKSDNGSFKLRFGLRGHLDTVRTVIFSGGGSPGEPEICTAGDDGLIKRFHIPRTNYTGTGSIGHSSGSDLDVQADFTHRGHEGAVLSLTSWFAAPNFSTGGRAQGDGWIFSGGQDTSIRVWERGRVDPKATIEGHTDAVWALCVLPTTLGAVFGQSSSYGPPERIILVSGAADGAVKVWAVSAPPQMASPAADGASASSAGSVRGGRGGRVRGNSMSSGSAFASTPQPTIATNSPFHHTLIHTIMRAGSKASPTCIASLSSSSGNTFVVSYADASIIVYDTRTGEEIGSMASLETYDGTISTSVNAIAATTVLEQSQSSSQMLSGNESSEAEGIIISGHEDRFIRFYDANSGQCTYNMLAHPAAISSLSLSPDGRELVSAGHDASLRFWSLEKRACTQEMTAHRIMRGEGVCSVVWSQDGRWVVSGGGDGVVKVFAR